MIKALICFALILGLIGSARGVWGRGKSRMPRRMIWGATGAFALVLAINDVFFPDHLASRLFGGGNTYHLIRNVLTMTSCGLLHGAFLSSFGRMKSRVTLIAFTILNGALIAGISISFTFIDQDGFSSAFVPEHLNQVSTVVYSLFFCLGIGVPATDMALRGLRMSRSMGRGSETAGFAGFAVGLLVVALSTMAEAAYVVGVHWAGPGSWAETLGRAFSPLFFLGLLIVASSLAVLRVRWIADVTSISSRVQLLRVRGVWERCGAADHVLLPSEPGWRAALSSDPGGMLYRCVVSVEDALGRSPDGLSHDDQARFERACRVAGYDLEEK